MRVLLDECVNQQFRHAIAGHDVFTTGYMGWDALKNDRLLAAAAAAGFVAIITRDRGIEHQRNRATLPLSVVVLHSSNDLPALTALLPHLLAALVTLPSTPAFVNVRA